MKGGFAAFSNLGSVGLASSFKHQSTDIAFKLSLEGFCETSFTLFGLNLDRHRLVLRSSPLGRDFFFGTSDFELEASFGDEGTAVETS